jgi:hypothetical protein
VAITGVVITNRANDRIRHVLELEREASERGERRGAIEGHFRSLLSHSVSGLPDQYQLTIYVPVGDFLLPVFPRIADTADPAIFPKGAGATGRAWNHPDLAFAVAGEGVSNDEYGLTLEQRRRFATFRSVGATVIRDEGGHRAGVLTAIGRQDDRMFTEQGRGIEVLRGLATNLSHLMADARKWLLPDESEEHAFRELTWEAETSLGETQASTPTDAEQGAYKSFPETPEQRAERLRARKEHARRAAEVAQALRLDRQALKEGTTSSSKDAPVLI